MKISFIKSRKKFSVVLTVLYLGVAAFDSVHAMTLDPEEFVCPVNGKKFIAEVVGSYAQFSIRLDLRPLGALAAPEPRPVCPDSGFVMTKDTYTTKEAAAIRKLVSNPGFSKARAKYNDDYMAAYQLAKLGKPLLQQAWSYHKAGWKAEDSDLPDAAYLSFYRELALKHFDKYFDTTNSAPTLKWWDAQIVAANLERKLGRFDDATQRIDNLPTTVLKPSARAKQFIKKTRQQAVKKNKNAVDFSTD